MPRDRLQSDWPSHPSRFWPDGIVIYSRQDRDRAAAPAAPQPIPVIATTVQQHDVPIVLTGLGTVTALNAATVRSQITGLLVSVDFKEGQFVKKGDLLAQIDPRTYQAQLDEAEATLGHDQAHLHNGELNLQRYTELVKEDSASRQLRDNQQAAVDELNAQIKIDEAAIENDKAQLSYTRLVAPFDGVTGFRLLDVGSIITRRDRRRSRRPRNRMRPIRTPLSRSPSFSRSV